MTIADKRSKSVFLMIYDLVIEYAVNGLHLTYKYNVFLLKHEHKKVPDLSQDQGQEI